MTRYSDVAITIDVEHDCPPFLSTYRGITEGLPRLSAMFAEEDVPATFFTTGDVARRYPDAIRAIVDGGHELGCHGDTHRRFGRMRRDEAQREIADSTETLRRFADVTSFRAPNLDFPDEYLPLLRDAGFSVDSSQGSHKPRTLLARHSQKCGLVRLPATVPSSVLRLPRPVRHALCAALPSPVVFFTHPWEFVDVTREPIPYDCRFGTGEPALASLRATIRLLRRRGARFLRMRELAAIVSAGSSRPPSAVRRAG